MLNENIRAIRKSRGLSQEELAIKLNVVRQTVSKWERGLSVPDSDMLVSLSDTLDAPVATLLGKAVSEPETDDLRAIAERLEVVNLQLACKQQLKRKVLCGVFVAFARLSRWRSHAWPRWGARICSGTSTIPSLPSRAPSTMDSNGSSSGSRQCSSLPRSRPPFSCTRGCADAFWSMLVPSSEGVKLSVSDDGPGFGLAT